MSGNRQAGKFRTNATESCTVSWDAAAHGAVIDEGEAASVLKDLSGDVWFEEPAREKLRAELVGLLSGPVAGELGLPLTPGMAPVLAGALVDAVDEAGRFDAGKAGAFLSSLGRQDPAILAPLGDSIQQVASSVPGPGDTDCAAVEFINQ